MVVENFCGCTTLEKGGIVVGIIGLITNGGLFYLFLHLMLFETAGNHRVGTSIKKMYFFKILFKIN